MVGSKNPFPVDDGKCWEGLFSMCPWGLKGIIRWLDECVKMCLEAKHSIIGHLCEVRYMKVHVLKCPECRATLDLEDGMKFIFCKYCGTKVYVDDQKFESTFNVNKTSFHTHRYVNEADVIRAKTESKSHRKELVGFLVVVALFVVTWLSGDIYFANERRESNAEEERLQKIVEEVLVDIENGNYDVAYIKANSLYYTSGWSDDIENKWDSTREALLEKIEEAQAAAKDGAENVNENSQDAEAVSDEKSLKDSVLDLFKE